MIYCMSDIHGDYKRYQAMLELISFSDDDRLYVIGDAIDRGSGSIDLVLDMMGRKNVVFLRGNHEEMCLNDLVRHEERARSLWQMNHGGRTRSDLLYKRTPEIRVRVLSYFRNAPVKMDLTVSGREFHLVHGFPADNEHDCLWKRPEIDAPPPIPGKTVVVGHTPTCFMTGREDEPFRIWHGNGVIDIDCGCASRLETRRLACLRLDDMEEFYV